MHLPPPRAVRRYAALLSALVFLSCDGADRPSPTQPVALPERAAAMHSAGDSALAERIFDQIDVLFLSLPRRQQATQQFEQVMDAWRKGLIAEARSKAEILLGHTVDQLNQGLIGDPDGSGPLTAVTGVAQFANDVYAFVGLGEETPVGENTYVAVIEPSAEDQTFNSGLGAWVVIPANTFSQTVLLYVNREVEGEDLNSGLPPASDPYEVHFIPDIPFEIVYVAICAEPHDLPLGSTRLAHELDDGTVEILEPLPNPFVCEVPTGSGPTADATPSMKPRGFLAHAGIFARAALRTFQPTKLFAGHSATMGGLTTLSPIQVVITGTRVTSTATGGGYGTTATIDATLTDVGDTPLAGRTLALTLDGAAAGSAVTDATGKVTFSLPGLAAGSHPYTVSFAGFEYLESSSHSGTVEITQASLVLTAGSGSATYGNALPACTVTYSGLVNGDTKTSISTGVSSCTFAGLPIGTSVVVPTDIVPAPANYSVSKVNGSFTLNPRALTLTVPSVSIVFGAPIPACVVQYSGLASGDTPSSPGLGSTCTYPNVLGTSIVSPSAITSPYYTPTYVSGTFTMVYNTTVGHYFISPLPMREIQRGSKVPAKFQLFRADGVTPVTTGSFKAYVTGGSPAVTLGPLGTFTYKASSKTWELTLDTTTWPLGVVTLFVPLGDGSSISVQEVIK